MYVQFCTDIHGCVKFVILKLYFLSLIFFVYGSFSEGKNSDLGHAKFLESNQNLDICKRCKAS